MAEVARVDSTELIRLFKPAIFKFQETAIVALGDAESELHRTLVWLETEQDSFWQGQIRKRQEAVTRAKEAVRMKKIFKDASGRVQSAVDEEKVLQQAIRKLQEAEEKLRQTRRWARALQKEVEMYKGGVQRFATTVHSDLPNAAAYLEQLAKKLDDYMAVQAGIPAGGPAEAGAGAPSEPSMSRGRAMSMPAGSPQEAAQLRQQAPTAQQRAGAPISPAASLAVPPVSEQQRTTLAPLLSEHPAPVEGKIYISVAASAAQRLFLGRTEPSSADDTGWSLASADLAGGDDWTAVTLADFLRLRPDFADLLALPPGFSVIIDAGGVESIIDPRQQTAWRRGT